MANVELKLRGGRVHLPSGPAEVDVGISGGKIVALDASGGQDFYVVSFNGSKGLKCPERCLRPDPMPAPAYLKGQIVEARPHNRADGKFFKAEITHVRWYDDGTYDVEFIDNVPNLKDWDSIALYENQIREFAVESSDVCISNYWVR